MKQALVLGLAFAANAMTADQVDNELIVAPSGGKLGDLTKLPTKMGRVMFDEQAADEELFVAPQGKLADLAKKYPGMIMFDEQADDELMVRLLPRESFQTEEEYQKYLVKMRVHRDDELFVAPQGKLGELAKKYPGKIMFDEQADDELLIRPIVQADDDEFIAVLLPREHFKTEEEYQKYVAKMRFHRDDEELFVTPQGKLGELAKKYPGKIMFDEQADEELMVRLLPRESFKTEEEYKKYLAKVRFHLDDEELFVAPEGRLGEIAKKYPGKIMFDEADDELIAMIPSRDKFKSEEDYQRFITRVRNSGSRDDAVDDELMVYYTKDSQGNKHYEGGYTVRRDDAADDELVQTFYSPSGADLVKYAKQSQQTVYRPTAHVVRDDADDELAAFPSHPSGADLVRNAGWGRSLPIHTPPKHTNPIYWSKNDDVADDELVQTFYSPSGADLVKYAKQSQQTVYRPTAHVVRDDADDELAAFPSHPSGADLVRNAGWGRSLPIHTPPKSTNPTYWSKNDDVADDELVQTFYSPSGADLVKYAKQSQQTVYRPTAHVVRDDADDELSLIPVRPKVFGDKGLSKPAKIPTSEAFIRGDDEGDDELVYLGHLIRHAENERLPPFRTFDDDELRAEKPSHVKAQEKAQMKAELPKMKRKLRPADETAFLA